MGMRKLAAVSFVVLVCTSVAAAGGPQAEAEKAAVMSAQNWLSLVDQGKYEESWKQAAEYFKGAIKPDDWQRSLVGFRMPLGPVLSRKVKATQYTTTLPGAPDGKYVVIQFATAFTNKSTAIETVTAMSDKDGTWRVGGYFIR